MDKEILQIHMVALRGMTVMPHMVVHFDVSRESSIEAVQEAMVGEQKIFLVTQKDINTENPQQQDLYEVGTIATVNQVVKLPKHIFRVVVSGEERAVLQSIDASKAYLCAEVAVMDQNASGGETGAVIEEAMARGLNELFFQYAASSPQISKETSARIGGISGFSNVIDEIAANIPLA